MSIINHLPTSEVCEIVKRVSPRLYIDFLHYLPPEVCLKILSFLDPVSLINTAQASKPWMRLALDRQLWERLYYLEGFRVVDKEVARFETMLNPDRSRSGSHLFEEHASKKRATVHRFLPALHTEADAVMTDVGPSLQEPLFRPSLFAQRSFDRNELMSDQPSFSGSQKNTQHLSRPRPHLSFIGNRIPQLSPVQESPPSLSRLASLVVLDRSDGKKKLNWQHIYSMRRRLEENWEAEKYTNFQLPHPNYPEEAHKECIYTIQHSGKYLVSGSRDHTLRIWDLDTRRLVRAPLRAHVGSVLCLQFDADPEEDLIVSGSSDATVILWKFSTGQILQRMKKAHRESVLNVRFDKRVLVTCSKDKTIKIFNRRPLAPGDLGYAVGPAAQSLSNFGYNPGPSSGLPVKPAYSMIGCLEGHGAAVNAVQIYGNEVVSASGDRTVKVWDWPDQTCIRTFPGHQKGIACVQYDGRRIVSGSSDNEVKVFDKHTGVEVASLRAHTNLVRTVQAGFGDLPYSLAQDKEDARKIDEEYFKAVEAGVVPHVARRRDRGNNAGSCRPEDITAYGANLPPGGGGGRFGRIVSGSYDETIIIWRRDREGVWKAQHRLRQEAAANAASRADEYRSTSRHTEQMSAGIAESQTGPGSTDDHAASMTAEPSSTEVDAPTQPFAPGSRSYYHHIIDQTMPNGAWALQQAIQSHPELINYAYLQESIDVLPDTPTKEAMGYVVAAAINAHNVANNAIPNTPNPSANQTPVHQIMQAAQAQLAFQANTIPSGIIQPGSLAAITALPTSSVAPAGQPHHHHAAHAAQSGSMARVFKLQFDARRIICCSQTPIIVGWDFANGDEQIIEASRFFAPIE